METIAKIAAVAVILPSPFWLTGEQLMLIAGGGALLMLLAALLCGPAFKALTRRDDE